MRTPFRKHRHRLRRRFAGIAGVTAAAILGTLLVPTAASADVPTVPPLFHETLELGGTGDLDYRRPIEVSNPDASCSKLEAPWIVLTDDVTGQEYLGDEWYAYDEIRFQDTGMRYPGNSFTLTFYDKVSAGADCMNWDPDEFLPGASPYKIVKVDVDWEKPEVLYAHQGFYDGAERLFLKLSSRWEGFSKSPYLGGPAVYEITDYGLPNQKIRIRSTTCYHPQDLAEEDECILQSSYDNGDIIGIAAMPAGQNPADSDVWPPVGAISSTLWTYFKGGWGEAGALTQAGPNESMECYQMCAGDPVDTSNGNLYDRQSDLTIPGRIGLEIQRSYSTGQLGITGAFGPGTALSYDMQIEEGPYPTVTVVEPSGNRTAFKGYSTLAPVSKAVRADLVETNNGWEFSRWDEDETYVFNEDGELSAIRDTNGNTVSITHDAGHIARIVEGDRWIDLTWNGDLLAAAKDHTGREVSYSYNADGRLGTITNPAGNAQHYSYDGNGRVTQLTAPDGGVTSNIFDAEGRITEQTMPDGQVLTFAYGTPDDFGKVTNTETVGNVVRSYTYINGRIAEFSDSSDPLAAFTQSYDAKGRAQIKNYVDGYPRQEIYGYDSAGNRAAVSELTTGATSTAEFDTKHRLIASTDASGVRKELTRDSAGNITASTTIANDGSPSLVTSYQIDTNGDQLKVTDPEGGVTAMTYTPAGEVATITDPEGGVTSSSYDSLGRLVETTSPGGNVAGNSATDAELFTTEYSYDLLGNALSVTDAQGATTYTYDAMSRPLTVTDARGKIRSSEYDSMGRLVKDIAPDGSFDQFAYDVHTGLRTSWTDPNGLVTSYNYDAGSTTVTSPSGDVHTTTIELRGENVVTIQDGAVVKRVNAHTTTTYPDENTSLVERHDSAGRVVKTETPDGTVDYTYDGFGRLIAQEGTDRDVSYSYDDNDQITAVTYPDDTTVLREYDAAGRVETITDWAGGEREFYYDVEGRVSAMSSDTSLGYTQSFDGLQTTGKLWSEGTTEIASFDQTFEATGGLISFRDGEAYGFDDNGSLTTAGSDTMTWDGRLLTGLGDTTLSYGAQSGRLETVSDGTASLSYKYDDRGNRTSVSDGTDAVSYGWNQLGQLTNIGAASFGYGSDGIRTNVDDAAQVYDLGLKLLSDGTMKYLWAPDGSLLAQAPLGGTSGVEEAVTDLQGSVRQVLDGGLTKLAEYSYTVFGVRTLESGNDVTAMGFTSEQHDDSGLIYLRYRYYDPAVGQFISVDPMLSSTLDPYGYANGNPLQVVDPLGLFGWGEKWDGFASFMGAVGKVASVVGATAAVATLFVATGGTAAIVLGAVVTASTAAGVASTAVDLTDKCIANPSARGCTSSITFAAMGPALSRLPGVREMRELATSPAPVNATILESTKWAEKRAFAQGGVTGVHAVDVGVSMVDIDC